LVPLNFLQVGFVKLSSVWLKSDLEGKPTAMKMIEEANSVVPLLAAV